MTYEGNLFRPPSEAYSLLIQVTIGCSHNGCTFCGSFKEKKFRMRKMEEIKADILECSQKYQDYFKRIFLCDANALVMQAKDLQEILRYIKEVLPSCERVGIYGAPSDVLRKSAEELRSLKELGLDIIYMGLESGSDEVLKRVRKGADQAQMIEAAQRVKAAGIKLSVMAIIGLGGQELWQEHALETAKALNGMQPDYAGLLALMIVPGTELYDDWKSGAFQPLTPKQVVLEMDMTVKDLELENCFFSSVHASNYVNLKGTLPQDKQRLLSELDFYKNNENVYRKEKHRGL